MYDSSYILTQPDPFAQSFSGSQFEIIKRHVTEFQASLDDTHDVGVLLTHMGSTVLMEVKQISYEEPVLMVFKGYVDNRDATLIQHISQLNFLLTTVPKDPETPHRTIGFTANWAER